MKRLYQLLFLVFLLNHLTGCNGQTKTNKQTPQHASTNTNKLVGGGCDGCELMYIGMPENINATDTSAGWNEKGQRLLVTGTVYKSDGRTPSPNVIIYYWQTDNEGFYSPTKEMNENAKRHGHIRGWIKADENGKYSLYTIRPSPYPNADIPAHIHTSIKEPNVGNEYYIDEFVFDDDKLLTAKKRKAMENRGGSGILRVLISDNLQVAEHNIILGLNIPNYSELVKVENQSGLQIGEDQPSFIPHHAWGTDKGTRTCPVCKYGRYHGIVYFVGDNPEWSDIKKWLAFLEQESISRNKYLKAYFVYGNKNNYNKELRKKELEQIGKELNLINIALTFVPAFADEESDVNLNKINPEVENTIIIYRHQTIIDKFISLKPTAENFKIISNTLDKTKSDYFQLSEPKHD